MREKLIRYIKKHFGLTYGSRELKNARAEITQNALARYDEELANGASEDAAYGIAVDSLGDVSALTKPLKAPMKKRAAALAVTISLTALLALLALTPIFIFKGTPGTAVFFVIIFSVPPVLMGYGMISLANGVYKKTGSIVCLSLGGAVLLHELAVLAFFLLMLLPGSKKYRFDYTDDIGRIKSIELVQVVKTARYEDDFEYKVKREIPADEWPELLARIAELEYVHPMGVPPGIYKGDSVFLIRFDHTVDGMTFAIIGRSGPGGGKRADSRIMIDTDPYWCDTDEFNALLKDFG